MIFKWLNNSTISTISLFENLDFRRAPQYFGEVCNQKTNGSPSLALMEVASRAFSARNITDSRNPYLPIKPILSLLTTIFESAAEMLLKN